MESDHIVDQIREIRRTIAARHDYDLRKLFAHWKELEKSWGDRVVAGTLKSELTDRGRD